MSGRRALGVAALLLVAAAAVAQREAPAAGGSAAGGAPAVASLFPHRAPLAAPAGRLVRLALPPAVLAACRRDLSDLRIVDAGGAEVPFLLHRGPGAAERLEVIASARPRLLDARRRARARKGLPPVRWESYELSAPTAPPEAQRWDLVLVTGRSRFVRALRVEAGGKTVAEGSVFRLAGPGRENLRLALPALSGDRLRVVLEGEDGELLEPSFRYERVRVIAGEEGARVPLAVVERHGAEGRTTVELERPGSLVPDRLVLATDTPAFDRRVEVWDEGPGAAREPLAEGSIYRLPGPPRVEGLEVPLRPARGDRLRVVIDDGDSPPLATLEVRAAVPRPTLLFALPAGAGPAPSRAEGDTTATLLFGGGRALRPSYDLEALRAEPGRPVTGDRAEILERLADPAALPEARLGEASDNPTYDPAPALAFAMHPGAPVEAGLYRWRRHLEAEPSPEGLVRLRLDLDDLARARRDLADLRISDETSHQWAYLVEEAAAREARDLEVGAVETRDGRSRYPLTPSAAPVTLDGVSLEVGAPFFDRAYTLEGLRDGEPIPLASGRLVRRAGDPRPLAVAFPPARVEGLDPRRRGRQRRAARALLGDRPLPGAGALLRGAGGRLRAAPGLPRRREAALRARPRARRRFGRGRRRRRKRGARAQPGVSARPALADRPRPARSAPLGRPGGRGAGPRRPDPAPGATTAVGRPPTRRSPVVGYGSLRGPSSLLPPAGQRPGLGFPLRGPVGRPRWSRLCERRHEAGMQTRLHGSRTIAGLRSPGRIAPP